MPGYIYFASDPYQITNVSHTYAEKNHHLHHVPLTYMAYNMYTKFDDNDDHVHMPKADVRETPKSFHVEVELPGIKNHAELRLRWTNDRTLLVTSRTPRPEIPGEDLVEEHVVPEINIQGNCESTTVAATEEASTVPTSAAPKTTKPKQHKPHLTVHERPIGQMNRAFAFPVDVDRDATHAKLDAGILHIVVPKVVHAAPSATEEHEEHFFHVPIKIFNRGH